MEVLILLFHIALISFSEDELKGVDLSSWKVAYCGSEPIRDEVIKGFIEKFEPYGFNPNAFFLPTVWLNTRY